MKRSDHVCRQAGFTLVELLVVMAIVALLAIGAIMALNPSLLVGKARDSQRKSDLNKIKTAFEEYYNDKGFYPSYSDLANWNVVENCNKQIDGMAKYLNKWLCDPDGQPYTMITDNEWFKVLTNLENEADKDIPDGWYTGSVSYTTTLPKNEVNYGVSSSNVLWYDGNAAPTSCGNICLKLNSKGCNDTAGSGCKAPDVCYLGTCATSACRVYSCQ